MPVQMKWIVNIEQTAGRLFNLAVLWNNQIHNLYPIAFCRFQLLAIFDKWSWQGALHHTGSVAPQSTFPIALPKKILVCLLWTAPSDSYSCRVFLLLCASATTINTNYDSINLPLSKYDLSQKWEGKDDTSRYQSWLFVAPRRPLVTRTAWTSIRKGRLDWKRRNEFASVLLNSPVIVTTWLNNRCKNYLLGFPGTI